MSNLVYLKAAVLSMSLIAGSSAIAADGDFELFGNAEVLTTRRPRQQYVVLTSDVESGVPYAGISYTPKSRRNSSLLLMDVERLAVNYQVIEGGIGGGAPRFSIGVDTDFDGEADGNVFVYLGDPPNFTETTGDAQFSGNLVTDNELRVDSSQLGGSFYGTFEDAVDVAGFGEVLYIDFVVDAGWSVEGGVQSIVVTDLEVNRDNVRLRKLARQRDR